MTGRVMSGAAVAILMAASLTAQEVTKDPVTGSRNFARLGTTVACAGGDRVIRVA